MPIYMKFAHIGGSSTATGFTGQFEADSLSFSDSKSIAYTGSEVNFGTVEFSEVQVQMPMGVSSDKFCLQCFTRKPIDTITITVTATVNGNVRTVTRYTLTETYITNINIGADAIGVPSMGLSIRYHKIKYESIPVRPDGTHGDIVIVDETDATF
ncbi:MAG TPA: type VI secretion system tube protein Hcp [Fimbriimonas sp.]|nr:type VI secretion system tube protein Hcp [Fimbriimonas sp.]